MNDINFHPHEVKWLKEKVANFWNYYVSNERLSEISVAKENGKEIVMLVKKYLKKDGNNLDYGCGAGYLMEILFKKGISCAGLDSSDNSLEEIKNKFKDNILFKGTILSSSVPDKKIADSNFDFVFLIETIEHIFQEEMEEFLKELHRIIKPGGYLFLTTPNEENLDRKKIICPECGAIFHRVQHMSSFSVGSLAEKMESVGFKTVFLKGTFLGKTKNVYERIKCIFNFLIAKIFGGKVFQPNLIYLGKK